jgi:hypothetical protein
MLAPARANSRTMARPKPADAPVTTTTSGLLEGFMIFSLQEIASQAPDQRRRARIRADVRCAACADVPIARRIGL